MNVNKTQLKFRINVHNTTPVSYTHLDVYKRQEQYRDRRLLMMFMIIYTIE